MSYWQIVLTSPVIAQEESNDQKTDSFFFFFERFETSISFLLTLSVRKAAMKMITSLK